ncbi:nuclear transport factor 2 family protein [Rhodococcus hoagii]|nr:nuclear transport factor 2 family protein [Prescottella equi]
MTVERLGAVESIRALAHRYTHLVDEARLEEVADLFAHAVYGQCDGTGRRWGRCATATPPACWRRAAAFIRMHGTPPRPRTKHVVPTCGRRRRRLQDRDVPVVLHGAAGNGRASLQPILTGRYFDAFAVRDGEWMFTQRHLHRPGRQPQ